MTATTTQTTDADILAAWTTKTVEIAKDNGWTLDRTQTVMLDYLRDTDPAAAATIADALTGLAPNTDREEATMERAPWERPKPFRPEGMNDTGIREGDKIMAEYDVRLDGKEFRRTVVMHVNSAWPLQNGSTYVSNMDADGHGPAYAVHTDSIRIIA